MKFYQTRQFVKLQKEWSEKLIASGFYDLESNGETMPHGAIKRPERITAMVEYYVLASRFYWDYNFETPRDKTIWFYHSEGMPYRDIVKLIEGESLKSVFVVVNKLKTVFFQYVKAQDEWENEANFE